MRLPIFALLLLLLRPSSTILVPPDAALPQHSLRFSLPPNRSSAPLLDRFLARLPAGLQLLALPSPAALPPAWQHAGAAPPSGLRAQLEWWGLPLRAQPAPLPPAQAAAPWLGLAAGSGQAIVELLDALGSLARDGGGGAAALPPHALPRALLLLPGAPLHAGASLSLAQRLGAAGYACWGSLPGVALACLLEREEAAAPERPRALGAPPPPLNPFWCDAAPAPAAAAAAPGATASAAAAAALQHLHAPGGLSLAAFPAGFYGALLQDLQQLAALGEGAGDCLR